MNMADQCTNQGANQEPIQDIDQRTDQIVNQKADKKRGKKNRKYLKILWPLLVQVLITLLYFISFGLVAAIIYGSARNPSDLLKGNIMAVYLETKLDLIMNDTALMMIPLQLVWIAVYYRWYSKEVHINPEKSKRCLQKKNLRIIWLLTIGANLFISGAFELVMPYLGKLGDDYIEMMNDLSGGNILFTLIGALILAPIAEELICRGIIMKKARETFPFAVANVIQAIIFGVMHMNIIQGSYAFILGLILGYVAYRFDSILPAILMHFLFNLLGLFILYSLPIVGQILEVVLGVGIIIYTVRILGKLELQETKMIN